MKTLFLLLILALYSNVFSQITLTASNNPVPGNSMRSIFCDTTLVQGNSGANQSWNFSVISFLDSSYQNWVNSSSTPYSAQFPLSNIAAQADNEDSYTYFATSTSGMTENGYGGTGNILLYSDPKTILQYPFTYNSSFSDNFAATYTISGSDVKRTGTTTVSGDAWGTINLPSGSYSNSLRVKYIISTRDSSNPGIPVVTVTNVTFFRFIIRLRKISNICYLFIINYSSISMPKIIGVII